MRCDELSALLTNIKDYRMKHIFDCGHLRCATFATVFAMATLALSADIPVSYYRTASGKKEADLKDALHELIYNHTEVSSYTALPEYFRRTDVYPVGNDRYGEWWDMYGNIPLYVRNGFGGMNREHSFPKSWWGGSTDTPAYVDLNHLYPAEAEANMAKSNYPLGVVNGDGLFNNGVTKVGYPVLGQGGGAAQVFEPADEYKGDFARTYFYMVTCYQNLNWKYTYMVGNNTYPTLNAWSTNLLLQWHRDDPVSQKELDRNEEIYKIQANRNPFIDYPELAEYLWGKKKGQIWFPGTSSTEPEGTPELITPVQDMSLDFGETAIGSSSTASLFFQGQYLTGSLTISIYRGDAQMFTANSSQISASVVNSASGYWLKVTYTPTAIGSHTARLVVSDGGIDGSRGIELRGECLAVPTLHSFQASQATDITANSYIANWDVPTYRNDAGEITEDVVDYYVVTRTVYNNGASGSEDIVAESNELLIDNCDPNSRESYNVRSCRLGYYSERSNEIYVTLATDGIEDVAVDNPLGWAYTEGGVRLVCNSRHTGGKVYDASGRLIRTIPVIENNLEVKLPYGAFFIVTDQQRTPIRVLVRD